MSVFDEIRDEWRRNLKRVINGDDPMINAICYDEDGRLCDWARGPREQLPIRKPHILRAVSTATGVPTAMILGKRRQRAICRARQLTCYLMCQHCPASSLKSIGAYLGLDHTTVLYARGRIGELLCNDIELRGFHQAARTLIRQAIYHD